MTGTLVAPRLDDARHKAQGTISLPLPRGRQLVTLQDAGSYITRLPKAEHEAAEWPAAMECLILVATHGGPTMMARVGVMRALNRNVVHAARKRHDRLMGLVAKAKTEETKERYNQAAKNTLLLAAAAARRLQITAENAADSYARSMKKAAEGKPAKKAVKKNKS